MKKITLKKAKERAYNAFKDYIRLSASVDGYVTCYTCGSSQPLKEIQVGHWVEGHGNAVYINEEYVRPQCVSCNIFHHGRQGEFRDKLREELGSDIVNELLLDAHITIKYTVEDYLALEKFYLIKQEALK